MCSSGGVTRDRYELERGSTQVVRFVDDTTLEIDSSRGMKQFTYDSVFTPDSTQDQIFQVRCPY